MNDKKIMKIEIIMIIYTLFTSPLAGIMFLGYILKKREEFEKLENRIKILETEEQEANPPKVEPTATPSFLHQYKECLILDYNRQFFLIQKPSGDRLEKTFKTLEEAIRFANDYCNEYPYVEYGYHIEESAL